MPLKDQRGDFVTADAMVILLVLPATTLWSTKLLVLVCPSRALRSPSAHRPSTAPACR
jgi:hypothetical protein